MAPVETHVRDRVAVVTIDNPPVNALSNAVRRGLLDAIGGAERDADVDAVVVRGTGKNFIAGADIREFEQPLEPPHTSDVIARIEALDKPVVAAIHGNALGGGLEIALGCHARIASTEASIGFPEVRLGLIPGAGGTQRLPRLVGSRRALELMLLGTPVDAVTARDDGIVDDVVVATALLETAMERGRALAALGERPRIRELDVEPIDAEFFAQYRARIAEKNRGQLAPECILASVENSLTLPFEEAIAAERGLFMRCRESPQSKAMRYAFFAERRAAKPLTRADAPRPASIGAVAVLGAGTMGTGIAQSCLAAGLHVILHDADTEQLGKARARITERAETAAARGRLEPHALDPLLGRLVTTEDIAEIASADLVIEAVFESLALKRELFAKLDRVCSDRALFATNTSTLDVDEIAAATRNPERVIGLHFFSPAHVMRLVEIVRGARSADAAVAAGAAFVRQIGKLGVVVGNAHGFVGNRMYHRYAREAQSLLLEGALPQQIDAALYDWGMAMGPHAVGDLTGLDVGYEIRREAGARANDATYFRIADVLVEAGRYGQKTGAGMYRYAEGSHEPQPDPEVEQLIAREAEALGIEQREIANREIVERCIFAAVAEGARVLESGVASRASDIDVIWLNGYGFPRYRGGPMYYADTVGVAEVLASVRALGERLGTRYWQPPRLLEDLAARGAGFAGR